MLQKEMKNWMYHRGDSNGRHSLKKQALADNALSELWQRRAARKAEQESKEKKQ